MHSVFLYHAIKVGMDMGIVNAGQLGSMTILDPPSCASSARTSCSTARKDATERLLEIAAPRFKGDGSARQSRARTSRGARPMCDKRLEHALVNGITEFIDARYGRGEGAGREAAARHRGAADGRHERRRRPVRRRQDVPAAGGEVGPRDEAGRRLPACPIMEEEKRLNGGGERQAAGKVLMATVKGDVHDIGKNIVGVVLQCNNYEVIDLGVMVPRRRSSTRRARRRSTSSGSPA
jgi:5-methyltetrahydrofolate--homocysteine methyltransferase